MTDEDRLMEIIDKQNQLLIAARIKMLEMVKAMDTMKMIIEKLAEELANAPLLK